MKPRIKNRHIVWAAVLIGCFGVGHDSQSETAPPTTTTPTSEMVNVPAGEFWMGCNAKVDSDCLSSDKPGHKVYLDAFQIDKTEVTVDAYKACVDAGKCSAPNTTAIDCSGDYAEFNNWGKSGRGNHPVNCVDWHQADTFCKWAGKQLPTEAQWEKAARGTDRRKYPWGNTDPASAGKVGNFADATAKRSFSYKTVIEGYDDGFDTTSPVGSFPAGPNGVYDTSGNVWEWTADWYDDYASSPSRNPKGPSSGSLRVVRGGSFNNYEAAFLRASTRHYNLPDSTFNHLGLRCAIHASP